MVEEKTSGGRRIKEWSRLYEKMEKRAAGQSVEAGLGRKRRQGFMKLCGKGGWKCE